MIHLSRFQNERDGVPIPKRVPPTARALIKEVADAHGVSVKSVIGQIRSKHLCRIRDEAYFVVRAHTKLSFPEIGKMFGRHHTTVIAGVNRHMERTR